MYCRRVSVWGASPSGTSTGRSFSADQVKLKCSGSTGGKGLLMIMALRKIAQEFAPPFIKQQWRELRRGRERGAVRIIPFGINPPPPSTSRPVHVIAGDPVTTTHNYFTNSSGCCSSGIWESTPGKFDLDHSYHKSKSEFVYLISGKVRLTDVAGHEETFGPGSAFIIPPGFKGSWEALEPLRKYYVTFS